MARQTAEAVQYEEEDDQNVQLVTGDNPTFNLLLVGDPGAGKTTLAATAQSHPKMRNVLFANIEGGMLSIVHRGDIHKRDIKSTKGLAELGWQLANGKFNTVHTIVIDNITELQQLNLEEIVTEAIKAGRDTVNRGQKGERKRTIDDVWQEDYQKSTSQLKRLFRFFRDLPMHCIFTAHAKRVYPKVPEGTDLTRVQPILIVPSLSQKLMESTMGYMDFVWVIEPDTESVDEKNEPIMPTPRIVVTQPAGVYRCKTRGPRFAERIGPVVQNPTLPELYDLFVETELAQPQPRKKR